MYKKPVPIGAIGCVGQCPECGGDIVIWEGDVSTCVDCGWTNSADSALNRAKRVLNGEIEPARRELLPIIVDIMGEKYVIRRGFDSEDPRMNDCDGFCDETTREIFAETYKKLEGDSNRKKDLSVMSRKVIRHEIIHAFLTESGLSECCEWAQNEEMVDWFARQGPKIFKAWMEAFAM